MAAEAVSWPVHFTMLKASILQAQASRFTEMMEKGRLSFPSFPHAIAVQIALIPNIKALPGKAKTSHPLISDASALIATGNVPNFLPAIKKSSRVLLNLEDQTPIKTRMIK